MSIWIVHLDRNIGKAYAFSQPNYHVALRHRRHQRIVRQLSMSDQSLLSPEYDGTKLLIFTAIFIPTQIIAVAFRYLARYLVKGAWGLDDVLILTSLSLQMCMAGLSVGRCLPSLHPCSREQSIDGAKDLSTTPALATTCPIWKLRTFQ